MSSNERLKQFRDLIKDFKADMQKCEKLRMESRDFRRKNDYANIEATYRYCITKMEALVGRWEK